MQRSDGQDSPREGPDQDLRTLLAYQVAATLVDQTCGVPVLEPTLGQHHLASSDEHVQPSGVGQGETFARGQVSGV